jgi:hypothetical protein
VPARARRAQPVTLDEFIEAQGRNLAQAWSLPVVGELIVPFVALYEQSKDLIPGSAAPYYGHLFLLCERSFLSAVSQILRLVPDDSAGSTRRAVEMARVALAVKHNRTNYDVWLAYEERMARWESRGRREKPRPVSPKYDFPEEHNVLAQLSQALGTLSDLAVHFTPEFLAHLQPKAEKQTETYVTMSVPFFVTDRPRLFLDLMYCIAIHGFILTAFDECFEWAFRRDGAWVTEFDRLATVAESWSIKILATMETEGP